LSAKKNISNENVNNVPEPANPIPTPIKTTKYAWDEEDIDF
jgi:hypothetical protein